MSSTNIQMVIYMQPESSKKRVATKNIRPRLEGVKALRALAALLIIIYHYGDVGSVQKSVSFL
mgnify:CR=1 FL=1